MASSLLITLREGLEISLVLAIIVSYLHNTGRTDRLPSVWIGAGAAAMASVVCGVAFNQLVGEFEGKWEQFIEGVLALTAAAVLTWMIFWMRGHSRGISSDLHDRIDRAIEHSSAALVFVAFVAVAREGFETALFLIGSETASSSGAEVVVGGLIGLALAAVLGVMLYLGTTRIDLRRFFSVTGILLILFAAGLVGKAAHEFREFFEFEAEWYSATVWNIESGPLADGWVHDFAKGLFGWSPHPERIRVIAYLAFLLPILRFWYRSPGTRPGGDESDSTKTVGALA